MAEWQIPGVTRTPAAQALADTTAAAFMSKVYRWMVAGLAITGAVALFTASSPAFFQAVLGLRWVLFIAQLGLVFALSSMAPRLSASTSAALFIGYAALTGLTFSVLLRVFPPDVLGQAFLLTAGTFGAMSAYGTLTKKSLSGWGTFLFMGLIGVFLASLVQMFWANAALSFVTSCACVVVFAGLTAYDTQKLRQFHASSGYASSGSLAITGALMLYLDFINLFIALVRLLGGRRR